MISLRKSMHLLDSRVLVLPLLWASLALAGCITRSNQAAEENNLQNEVSVDEDKNMIESLRQNIPETVRKKNDELAIVLNLMKEYQYPASEIRSRFDRIMRKKRDEFNRQMKKERDVYNKNERSERDTFLKALKKKRAKFKKMKTTREQSQEFYKDTSQERDDFFAAAKEKRSQFEGDFQLRRRDFESEYQQQKRDFSDQLRNYTKGYYDYQKNLQLKKKMDKKEVELQNREDSVQNNFNVDNQAMQELKEFEIIKTKPATTLQPEDN